MARTWFFMARPEATSRDAVGFFETRGLAGQCRILRQGQRLSRFEQVDRLADQPCPRLCSRTSSWAAVSSGSMAKRLGQCMDRRQFASHVDYGHAGFGLAVVDGPIDGRGAAILRQQRGMEVDASMKRRASVAGARICP